MTAYAMAGDREQCMAAGMDEYMSKPIKAEKLYEVLERFLGNRKVPGDALAKPPLDLAKTMEFVDGDTELVQEILVVFLDEYPRRMDELKKAIIEKDFKQLHMCAHSFRGAIVNFGAPKPAILLKRLEHNGKKQDISDSAFVLQELDLEMSKIRDYFNQPGWREVLKRN